MITCPECGQSAPDDARFCDRCGQGLTRAASAPASPTRPTPLAPGAALKHGIVIVESIGQTSIENRYRATRDREGKAESIILRERFAPEPMRDEREESVPAPTPAPAPAPAEDPNGPRAKTAELKPAAANGAPAQANGSVAPAGEPPVSKPDPGATAELSEGLATAEAASAPGAQSLAAADTAVASEAAPQAAPEALLSPADDAPPPFGGDDLGEVFGRVLALSQTTSHPAFQRASDGFSEGGRVYLVYPDEVVAPVTRAGARLGEADAVAYAVQLCQAISFIHRRALRLNDICPESVAISRDGRLKLTSLEYVSNDNELQVEPIFNDGFTAPEIYRGKRVDKRADIFSAGALLYKWLTGERIPSESWREEAGQVRFYPPHVVSPRLEQAVRRAIAFSPGERWQTIDEFKAELIALGGSIRLRSATMTDVGRVREHNEDSVMAVEYFRDSMVEPAHFYLYVVADGMGGAEAGEVASAIAVSTIRGYVEGRIEGADVNDPAGLLSAALEEANSKIIEYVAGHPESRGMGSTGVCALVAPPSATVAWVGDSRGYLMEGTQIRQVTRDHSLVQRLVEIGQISADEARTHEHKNVITRSLGARQSGPAGAEAVALKLKRGDKLLLCSDGLTAHLEDHDLLEILGRHSEPFEAARELIVAANAGGGTDNISVVVVFAS